MKKHSLLAANLQYEEIHSNKSCSNLTKKIPERRHWLCFTPFSNVLIVNFEQIDVCQKGETTTATSLEK